MPVGDQFPSASLVVIAMRKGRLHGEIVDLGFDQFLKFAGCVVAGLGESAAACRYTVAALAKSARSSRRISSLFSISESLRATPAPKAITSSKVGPYYASGDRAREAVFDFRQVFR